MVETLIGDYDPDSEKPDNRQLTHMIVSESTGKLITYDLPPTSINDEFWANAALLEAAPELLEACKRAGVWLGKMIADNAHLNSVGPSHCVKTLRMVEAASAKAERRE